MRVVFDAEADGFLEVATTCWCICTHELYTGVRHSFGPDDIEEGLEYLSEQEVLIGHNIWDYDLKLFKKLYGWTYSGKVEDTLVTSRVLWPDRPIPNNKIKGQEYNVKVYGRAHSLGAWGWRFNHLKPEHEDWSQFSPEMLHRCKEDVAINTKLLYHLIEREAHMTVEDYL